MVTFTLPYAITIPDYQVPVTLQVIGPSGTTTRNLGSYTQNTQYETTLTGVTTTPGVYTVKIIGDWSTTGSTTLQHTGSTTFTVQGPPPSVTTTAHTTRTASNTPTIFTTTSATSGGTASTLDFSSNATNLLLIAIIAILIVGLMVAMRKRRTTAGPSQPQYGREQTQAPPQVQYPRVPQSRPSQQYCPKCGEKNDEGVTFCGNCGNPLTSSSSSMGASGR